MGKKGVEMSLNVIIIAAIGLLILVILAFLVVRGINPLNKEIDSCVVKYGGTCQPSCVSTGGQTLEAVTATTDCSKRTDGKTACCKLFSSTG